MVLSAKTHFGVVLNAKTHFGVVLNAKTHFGVVLSNKTHFGVVLNAKTHFGVVLNAKTHFGVVLSNKTHFGVGEVDLVVVGRVAVEVLVVVLAPLVHQGGRRVRLLPLLVRTAVRIRVRAWTAQTELNTWTDGWMDG